MRFTIYEVDGMICLKKNHRNSEFDDLENLAEKPPRFFTG